MGDNCRDLHNLCLSLLIGTYKNIELDIFKSDVHGSKHDLPEAEEEGEGGGKESSC